MYQVVCICMDDREEMSSSSMDINVEGVSPCPIPRSGWKTYCSGSSIASVDMSVVDEYVVRIIMRPVVSKFRKHSRSAASN